jgi:hypothetical protein
MNKLFGLASNIRIGILLCSSAAVLLSACGGGTSGAGDGQPAKTAGYSFSSATGTPDGSAAASSAEVQDLAAADGTGSVNPAAAGSLEQQISDRYWWLLGRAPDNGGLNYWTGTGLSVDQVAFEFKKSAEHVNRHKWNQIVPVTAKEYYVDANAASGGNGSQQNPFRTLAAAAAVAQPSTTFWVAPGTYDGGIVTAVSGKAEAVQGKDGGIYWVSTVRWGAKIVPPVVSPSVPADVAILDTAWWNKGNYVSIVGFEVDGSSSRNTETNANWRMGVRTTGTRSVIKANYVHDIGKWTPCNGGGGAGIRLDGYDKGGKVDAIDNWVKDIGDNCDKIQGIYISSTGTIANNVLHKAGWMAIHLWHEASEVKIFNNTVAASTVGIMVGAGGSDRVNLHDYTDVHNNIVIGNRQGIREYQEGDNVIGTHNTYKNNLVYNNGTNWILKDTTAPHVGTVSDDPLFVGYSASAPIPNFHLASGSPAVGRGFAATARTTDFDGKTRGNHDAYAIGAYEP